MSIRKSLQAQVHSVIFFIKEYKEKLAKDEEAATQLEDHEFELSPDDYLSLFQNLRKDPELNFFWHEYILHEYYPKHELLYIMGATSIIHDDTIFKIIDKLFTSFSSWIEREYDNLPAFIQELKECLEFRGKRPCTLLVDETWAGRVPDGVIWRVGIDNYPGIVFEIGFSQKLKGPEGLEEKAGDWLEYSKCAINRVWAIKMDYGENNSTVTVQEFFVDLETDTTRDADGKVAMVTCANKPVEIRNKDGRWVANIPAVINIRLADMVFRSFVEQNPDPHWEHTFAISSDTLNKIIEDAEKEQKKGEVDRASGEDLPKVKFATDSNGKRALKRA